MLEVSCGSNAHATISFSRELEHVNNFKVNCGGEYYEKINNGGFGEYNGASGNLKAKERTFNLKVTPQSQSTPECKEKEPSTTKSGNRTRVVQVRSSYCNSIYIDNGSETFSSMPSSTTKSFPDCLTDTFESLDVQPPLLDYLVRHHAISEDSSLKIMQADKLQRPSLLLSAIGLPMLNGIIINSKSSLTCPYPPPPGLALLLNALRHTGHHELASYLDCSRRINPSSINSGMDSKCSDLTDKRRRGQISLWIQVLAIKVSPALYSQLTPNSSTNKTKDSFILPSHVEKLQEANRLFNVNNQDERDPEHFQKLPIWIDHANTPVLTTHANQSNMDCTKPAENSFKKVRNQWIKLLLPLMCCFHRPEKFNKMSSQNPPENPVDGRAKRNLTNNEIHQDINLNHNLSKGDSNCSIITSPDDLKTRIASQAILNSKSLQFYNSVLETGSALRDAIIKYLEQSAGVLVLDCKLGHFPRTCNNNNTTLKSVSALCVVLIATQSEIIRRLSEDCSLHSSEIESSSKETSNYSLLPETKTFSNKLQLTSKLADDLVTALIRAGALCQLGLQNLRLSVTLDPSEVQLAIKELMDLED
ncbi:unnamed protein product [Schistosoma turkestanicum]|nr:unnamed protein product [Schistosoma turkestanicum]